MDNLIPPLSSPNLNNSAPDKVVSGELENVPPAVQNIRPTESILLKIIMSEDSSLSGTVKLNINNQEVEIPLKISVDGRFSLPERDNNQAVVRFSGPDNSNVKILSINNDNPAKFFSPASALQAADVASPLIIDTGNAIKNISLHTLDLGTLIEKTAQSVKLPEAVTAELKSAFGDSKVLLSLAGLVENPGSGKELKKLDTIIGNSLERVKLILHNLNRGDDAGGSAVKEAFEQIKSEILPFKNMPLGGTAVTADTGKLIAVKTLLGNILIDSSPAADTAVKITGGTPLVLEIKDFVFPEKNGGAALGELLSSQKLIDEIVGLRSPLSDSSHQSPQSRPVIFNILEPLKNEYADLSAKILDKMPGQNNKMLTNLVGFMKGAVNNDLSRWLGKDILQELKQAGSEGQEIAARLNSFMNVSVREGVSWRLVEIPFLNGGQMNKIRVAVKKQNEEDEKELKNRKKASGLRFVVDTSFSKLGDFQFDGFAAEKEKRFDLIIRTSKAVDDGLYANLLRIFKTTLHELDYSGNVKLNVKENFIKVCDDELINETLKTGIYI